MKYNNHPRMLAQRVVKGGGGGHNPISHQKFFQNPSPSWIFIKNPSRSYKNPSEKIGIYRLKKTGLNYHMWLCVLHVAEVVSYLHGYLT